MLGLSAKKISAFGVLSSILLALSSNAATVEGYYNATSISSEMDVGGFDGSVAFGNIVFDPAQKRFQVTASSSDMRLAQLCKSDRQEATAKTSCKRFFDRVTSKEWIQRAGDYEQLADLTIRFKFDGEENFNPVEGLSSPDGNIVMLPVHPASGATLLIGMRPAHDLEDKLRQSGFDWNAILKVFPDDVLSRNGTWKTVQSGIGSGAIKLRKKSFQTDGSATLMQSEFSCRPSDSACLISAVQTAQLIKPFTTSDSFLVSPWGTIAFNSRDQMLHGIASGDGEFIVATADSARKTGLQAMYLMTKRGSDLSNTKVAGEFNAFALEDFYSSDGQMRSAVVEGSLVLDGDTWLFSAGTDSSVIRQECVGDKEHCFVGVSNFVAAGNATGQYEVQGDGSMTMDGIAIDGNPRFFSGNVSSNGKIIVLRRIENNINCDFFCKGSQSVRSLIVAVKRD